jgi:hypothetical protein
MALARSEDFGVDYQPLAESKASPRGGSGEAGGKPATRNTNRIGGRIRRASWHKTTKPHAIKGGCGKCGKGAGTVNVLIWGDLTPGGLRLQPSSRDEAEVAGVSRGHSTDWSQFVSGRAERQMCSEWNVRGMSEEGRLPQIEVLLVERSR